MHVLLLKEPRDGESGIDPYIEELAAHGHTAALVPVLAFAFVSSNTLSDKMFQPEKHGGLIFTSPRAVEAVKMCLETQQRLEEWNKCVKDKWNARSIYVVGKATASLVRSLGLTPLGEDTGTAEVLARVIIEREDTNIPPLFFPCGSIKREVLPVALRESGVPLETLTVYQTAEHPDLEKNLRNYFTEQGVPASVAFFSPSGVKFCLEVVRRLSGEQLPQIKFAAIGPTTEEAMAAEGLRVTARRKSQRRDTSLQRYKKLSSNHPARIVPFVHFVLFICVIWFTFTFTLLVYSPESFVFCILANCAKSVL
ncbi:unnamed protein product [Tetraodon nigroviridis]|uniref:Uroporphyrinogen-III synthase n=1 Tax=Tetraodon nigroviridis TaxID=99883 RepID=Q4SEB3_TETNG|nr:unnamed protein product [Tetraodon nigroviridis]